MSQFRFQILVMRDGTPREWLEMWAKRYDAQEKDDPEYRDLISRHASLTANDYRRIGKWKDNAYTDGKWKPNVAQVAFAIWEKAASDLPRCPAENAAREFLKDWSGREYTNSYASGSSRKMQFGPSRATTLLHFISGGRFPIFDSRVRTAIARLLGQPKELPNTIEAYWESYIPLVKELARLCDTEDIRLVDKALFSYGALDRSMFSEP